MKHFIKIPTVDGRKHIERYVKLENIVEMFVDGGKLYLLTYIPNVGSRTYQITDTPEEINERVENIYK